MGWSDHVSLEELKREIDNMSDDQFVGLLYRSGFAIKDSKTGDELDRGELLERFESLKPEDLQRPGAEA